MMLLTEPLIQLLEGWARISNSSAGRDSLIRLVQYFSRFLTFHLAKNGFPAELIQTLARLSLALATSRKLFRIGRPLDHFLIILLANRKFSAGLLKYCMIGKSAALGAWLFFDMLLWLNKLELVKFKQEDLSKVEKWAATGCLVGLLCGIIANIYLIRTFPMSTVAKIAEGEVLGGRISSLIGRDPRILGILCDLLADLLNLSIPLNTLKISHFNQGTIGLLGTISSMLSIYSTAD